MIGRSFIRCNRALIAVVGIGAVVEFAVFIDKAFAL